MCVVSTAQSLVCFLFFMFVRRWSELTFKWRHVGRRGRPGRPAGALQCGGQAEEGGAGARRGRAAVPARVCDLDCLAEPGGDTCTTPRCSAWTDPLKKRFSNVRLLVLAEGLRHCALRRRCALRSVLASLPLFKISVAWGHALQSSMMARRTRSGASTTFMSTAPRRTAGCRSSLPAGVPCPRP